MKEKDFICGNYSHLEVGSTGASPVSASEDLTSEEVLDYAGEKQELALAYL